MVTLVSLLFIIIMHYNAQIFIPDCHVADLIRVSLALRSSRRSISFVKDHSKHEPWMHRARSSMTLWAARLESDPFFLWVSSCNNQLALVPPPHSVPAVWPSPSCPRARTERSLLGWWGLGGLPGAVPPAPSLHGLTGGKKGGCWGSDWWGQGCVRGIECCKQTSCWHILPSHMHTPPSPLPPFLPSPPYSLYRNS